MNGDLLLGILTRNNLIVCNGTDICSGVLTRTRATVKGEEKSVIDFLIVCEELFAYMIEMKIDEEKLHSIESYSKKGGKTVLTPSDLNMIIGKFYMKIGKKETEVRKEIFDYKDEGVRKSSKN